MVMLSRDHLDEVANRFALLSDPTRLRVLNAVHERGEATVGEIAADAGTSVANASQHLLRLTRGGLLGRRRDAQTVRYRIVDETVEKLCAIVCADIRRRADAAPRMVNDGQPTTDLRPARFADGAVR